MKKSTQKQPFADVFQNRCSLKIPDIYKKTPVLESLFKKGVGPQSCNFLKKRLQRRCFLVNLANFLRTPFLVEHLWWLLLNVSYSTLPTHWVTHDPVLSLNATKYFHKVVKIVYHW